MNSFQMIPVLALALCACKSEPEPRSVPSQPTVSSSSQKTSTTTPSSTAPKQADISSEFNASAKVVNVSTDDRVVTLRREDGNTFDVQCSDAVRNFDQIQAGDELRVHYKQSLTATKLSAGESLRPPQATAAGDRAEKGERPGAAAARMVSVRVKIETIDRTQNIVVFSLGSGELLAHKIATPQGRDFLKGLAIGDVVQLDYTEAIALGVEKM